MELDLTRQNGEFFYVYFCRTHVTTYYHFQRLCLYMEKHETGGHGHAKEDDYKIKLETVEHVENCRCRSCNSLGMDKM